MSEPIGTNHGNEIAIIGIACRFPAARTLDEYWRNLRDGVETISFLSDEALLAEGADPELLARPNYVRAASFLADIDMFDAGFFGYSPREAQIMDPQHRIFLECAWEALEDAGYDSARYQGWIGVYGGAGNNLYRWLHLASNPELIEQVGALQIVVNNEKDFLTTRVSYKLNLNGPSLTVQTACSTSLVALHLACQSLISGECNMALAGGVSIDLTPKRGYLYVEGGIASPDGHCRAFDARAQGTMGGSGAGVVVLKLLEEALADGDQIHAVIKGSAINNDGAYKVGFTAPSVDRQTEVIAEALAAARVDPATIAYVETHGSGTPLGDPIEIAALTQAFRRSTEACGFCAIGSVKTNMGHLDTAAGIAGLIKTILALKRRQIPAHLHYERPNPAIDFANSPFYVNTRLREWPPGPTPRRAGVSSFGMGGTNAHVILEEAPRIAPAPAGHPWHLLALSARTATALDAMTEQLAAYLRQNQGQSLADIAYTYQVGRREFDHRRMLVCRDAADALQLLEARDPRWALTNVQQPAKRPIAFMFPGPGNQYVAMGRDLYRDAPVFRACVDECCALLAPLLGLDLRDVLYPGGADAPPDHDEPARPQIDLRAILEARATPDDAHGHPLNRTSLSQPALFVVEYALARLLISWGIHPQAMIGYSLSEYVAACLAGVFSLEDALALVAKRAQLIQALPEGGMLAVSLPAEETLPLLGERLSLAVLGGPAFCVVAGPADALADLELRLAELKVIHRRLQATHAFHSSMMDPIVEPFAALVGSFRLNPPRIPYLSNRTGTWITPEEATDPWYWAQHLRHPVRFSEGLRELWNEADRIMLEVGPGRTLCGLALQHIPGDSKDNAVVLPMLRSVYDRQSDLAFILHAIGKLWLAGTAIDWQGMYGEARPRRIALPTYPFERRRYWVEPKGSIFETGRPHAPGGAAEGGEFDAATDPFHPRPNLLSAYVAPQTEVEQRVAAIYSRLLGISQVGLHDNFFELGGDSLLATQLIAHLREAFGVTLAQRSIFETLTAASVAEAIIRELTARVEDAVLDQWLTELEQLSGAEPQALLDEHA